ncbi:MAG: penicillin-binding protein [Deltaproteobacteria bacterium]|nr:penicillin-binding protein [Deltaproteobacteria bacterium]
MNERLLAAGGVVGIGFMLVFFRLVQLTVVDSAELSRQAAGQHQRSSVLSPRRGEIVDRQGESLARSAPAESFAIRKKQLPTDIEKYIAPLAAALRLSPQEVQRKVRSSKPYEWLKRKVLPEEAALVRQLGIPGVESAEEERRFYPQGTLAAPLLGFTDIDAKGLEGIEKAYDQDLRGTPREFTQEKDALGKTFLVQEGVEPPLAPTVWLTLDARLQYIAEQELLRSIDETQALAGTAIILDPETFAVLALAQVPTFDSNAPGKTREEERRNPAISNCYEPGSTLKTLLAAAALDTQRVQPDERIFCEYGSYPVGHHVIHDHHPYGTLSFLEVLQHSSNIGAAKIGERLGKATYQQYLRAFGLGEKTGIDLPHESPGILAPVEKWARINLVTASFGQGIAVSPLQLVSAYAALANGGRLMKPYLIEKIVDAEGKTVKVTAPTFVRQVVRPETAKTVIELLEKVVEKGGTGWRAQIAGLRIAGKTGTSQKINGFGGYSAHGRIASFVGIVPADRPRLVILVMIDEPKTAVYGGVVAAPVFQAIASRALTSLEIDGNRLDIEWARVVTPPTEEKPHSIRTPLAHTEKVVSQPVAFTDLVELETNFLGMSLRQALQTAQREGVQVAPVGTGYVVHQSVQRHPESDVLEYALTLSPGGEGRP